MTDFDYYRLKEQERLVYRLAREIKNTTDKKRKQELKKQLKTEILYLKQLQ